MYLGFSEIKKPIVTKTPKPALTKVLFHLLHFLFMTAFRASKGAIILVYIGINAMAITSGINLYYYEILLEKLLKKLTGTFFYRLMKNSYQAQCYTSATVWHFLLSQAC